jgi:endoglucanase
MTTHKKAARFLVVSILLVTLIASVPMLAMAKSPAGHGRVPDTQTRFYVPKPVSGALQQIVDLIRHHNWPDALLIGEMITTPQAVWFTGGTPKSVKQDVKTTVMRAAALRTVPILVAYNIPFRDCAQFSAGGATSVQEYEAWIDAFAAGIGNKQAMVILEPDGLGIIPWYKQFRGTPSEAASYEWCQPAEADPVTAADDRFAMLNYAVDALKAQPNVSVYLDGTHSSWLGSGDAAHRLVQAGVQRADGFFVNVSNYRLTEHLAKYGTWISSCIAFANNPDEGGWRLGHYDWCASQYYPANPNDFSTWHLTDEWYASNLGAAVPTTHFVIDTSRNGQGPWTPTASYPDAQDWCNPPDRGVGLRPTADTGNPLIDAYLWVKIPGASDGECTRGLGPGGTTVDPEWGLIDPPAGAWFPEMALDLVHNANPPLPHTMTPSVLKSLGIGQ